ncbi:MAG: class I SAM-dependent methyltransferase [Chloroflexi bacterium]|nr:class I SAM-dependent methyltransferase [Chloroflexota bacterium]
MVKNYEQQKFRGGYYTPHVIADFLVRWAIQDNAARVLEPSCGDGVFLEATAQHLLSLGADVQSINRQLLGVELVQAEAEKSKERLNSGLQVDVKIGDFFAYSKAYLLNQEKFDVVVGNPPFIRYQNFPKQHRDVASEMMVEAGLKMSGLTNVWVPFVVVSTLLLKESGRLAMVVPAELFQVSYAAPLRLFLSEKYSRISLITFRSLLFDGIQQEVILLLGERSDKGGAYIRTVELSDVASLEEYIKTEYSDIPPRRMDHSKEKWTMYFLDDSEIQLIRELREHADLNRANDVLDVNVGVVTGHNQFFVLNHSEMQNYELSAYVEPIVTKSAHLEGAIFNLDDWTKNAIGKNVPAYLLRIPDRPKGELSTALKHYIENGEIAAIHKGFKCRVRKHWYVVPSVWTPDAFMLRQVHDYPKIVLNEASATCTDTIHRVKIFDSNLAKIITAAFLNSLTFAFSELMGRSYGGGVLTFEPSEARSLPLPLKNAEHLSLDDIDTYIRNDDIEAVLKHNDKVLLIEGLGLSEKEVEILHNIWEKLRDRRINRK